MPPRSAVIVRCRCCAALGLIGPMLPAVFCLGYEWYFRSHIIDCTDPAPRSLTAEASGLNTVHVVYSSDSRGFVGLLASMTSLSANLQEPSRCVIHLVVSEGDMTRAKELVECFQRELRNGPEKPSVLLHQLRRTPFPLSNRKQGPVTDIQQSFARFYLHDYLPAAPRAIWLDHDTIVQADVAPLYQMKMVRAIAAVPYQRFNVYETCTKTRHLQAILKRNGSTFNPGVMVLDLKRWRSGAITHRLERWQGKTSGCGDMIPLNLVFQGDFDILDWRWNVHPLGAQFMYIPDACLKSARILHWAGPFKCWQEYQAWERLMSLSPKMCSLFAPHMPRRQCPALS